MSLFYPKAIIIAILIHVVLFLAALNFEEVIRKAKCRKNFQNHTTVRISAAKKKQLDFGIYPQTLVPQKLVSH